MGCWWDVGTMMVMVAIVVERVCEYKLIQRRVFVTVRTRDRTEQWDGGI